MTASKKKGHDYYYCTNGKGNCSEHKNYLRETFLYETIADLLSNFSHIFTERKIELMYKAAKERKGADSEYLDKAIDTLRKELESLKTRESKLLDTFLAEQIPKELYENRILEIQRDRVSTKKQIKELEQRQPAFTLEPVKNVLIQANKSSKEFLEGDDMKKHEVVKNLLWNLSIKDKNIVNYQFKNVFQTLIKTPRNASFDTLCAG